MKTKILFGIFIIVMVLSMVLLNGCSSIESAMETKQQKCAKERAHCKAECNALEDMFGCSSKCDKHYEACIL